MHWGVSIVCGSDGHRQPRGGPEALHERRELQLVANPREVGHGHLPLLHIDALVLARVALGAEDLREKVREGGGR